MKLAAAVLILLLSGAVAYADDGNVQRNILLPPGQGNPRNSEAAMIDLADGRIMLVYSHFTGSGGDHAKGHLAARFSSDAGVTWTKEDLAVTVGEGEMNTMSPSLIRLNDGSIGLFYLRKNSLTDCRVFLRISRDEGKTWSQPIACTNPVGYYVLNNDRAVRLTGGRILLPVALHATPEQPKFVRHAAISCFWSDDDGKTWSCGASATGGGTHALEEPGVIELKHGRVMLWCRTDAGCQFTAFSVDRGEHWSELKPSSISSPRSPASIKRIPSTGDLLLVWNNNPDVSGPTNGKRTPLSVALSRDDGASWEKARNLEDNSDGWYCYIAIHFAGKRVILGHCADNVERSSKLATTQITSFPIQWLYGG